MNIRLFSFLLLLIVGVGTVRAQTETAAGIAFYKNKNYDAAISNLKKAAKTNATDATVWYYLGLSYLGKNKVSDSIKSFQKSIEINPQEAQPRVSLAYAYLLKNKNSDAQTEAQKSIALNPKIAEAHYILGIASFRKELFDEAYEEADKAIKLNSGFAAAYLLKSQSLTTNFAKKNTTAGKSLNPKAQILGEAADCLEKYLSLSPVTKETSFYKEYLESLKFFGEYYNRPEKQIPQLPDDATSTSQETSFSVISKPRANYTDEARGAFVSGIIRLLVGFSADGTVRHVLVIKPLGYGLDEEAVRAARAIKFKPEMKNNIPVSTVKVIEYSFRIG